MINKKDIIEFFRNQKCETCTFKKECKKLYDVTRMHSTNPQTICDGILDNVLFE